jgi:hypothetical protein
LGAELSEVEVRASAVSDIHGLPETLLGVVSIEDNAVEDDGDTLEYDFDEAADKRPRLIRCQLRVGKR